MVTFGHSQTLVLYEHWRHAGTWASEGSFEAYMQSIRFPKANAPVFAINASQPSRRAVVAGGGSVLAALLAGPHSAFAEAGLDAHDFGPASPFSFEALKRRAEALAAQPYAAPAVPSPAILAEIDYAQYQRIRYRPDRSLKLGAAGTYPVQFFHLGKYATQPVHVFLVADGIAKEVIYSRSLFDIPSDSPAQMLKGGEGFAGFRVMAPDLKTDWFAAMGASYFRTSGPFDQYGLSARGIAIDTALPKAEEFPRFSNVWLEGPERPDGPLTIHALLEGPSITGAYRMRTTRTTSETGAHRIDMDIEAQLCARKSIERVGIAPFSSMFWYGEANRKKALDWRPEIHDSDGLAILTGAGERLWRPISNPPRVMTSVFIDKDVKGFGLMQRDRLFDHYLDDGIFYDKRSSVWVEPQGAWGEGAVHLIEIPTTVETDDNIVAYWVPKEPFKAGDRRTFAYRLSWLDDVAFPNHTAKTVGTWTGLGGRPGFDHVKGIQKFVIDFEGDVFDGLGRNDGVEIVAGASRGAITNDYCHPVVGQKNRWRALFDIEALGAEPVDMRVFLRRNGGALTETWLYQYFPEA